MWFTVEGRQPRPLHRGPAELVLLQTNSNDYGYTTLYRLWLRNRHETVELGAVRIAYAGLPEWEHPIPPSMFRDLSDLGQHQRWFSLGLDDVYYTNVRGLGATRAETILRGLHDIAFSEEAYEEAVQHHVTQRSLLRGVETGTVTNQFRRIAQGKARLTSYSFRYDPPAGPEPGASSVPGGPLEFAVQRESAPPTNVHVLIGRNGSGKTTFLRNLARAVVDTGEAQEATGAITMSTGQFVNVVSVTFSAFDPFADITPPDSGTSTAIGYRYIGLAHEANGEERPPGGERRTIGDFGGAFAGSMREIFIADRGRRWADTLEPLASDPNFAQSPVLDYARTFPGMRGFDGSDFYEAVALFRSLSSGHAITLLTVTQLVEKVAEQSLVLLDEPETHLHPPLLAAFIRALTQLLMDRNAVGIIATHSPVVLQEVPRSCVYKLSRVRPPERPEIETFGENVGVLTHEVFGLETRQSGFQAELAKAVDRLDTYQEVLDHFGGQLGGEAKGLVRILLAQRAARRGPLS
ncbi:AAA family ATPase [Streptomyces specialis]|uniref:AAA family ATPase n=1 Tax=Streptomyces specialis TaxID=498367 RepID=UPI00073E51E3|nr:AAA family ATPase [Streptomyces specialis]